VVDDESLEWDVDVKDTKQGINLVTGNQYKVYCFTREGFYAFAMLCPTKKAKLVRQYFIKVEKEYKVVAAELVKAHKEIADLKENLQEANKGYVWSRTRDRSYDVQKDTMLEVKEITRGVNGEDRSELHPIVNSAINKAVLGFPGTTEAFKKSLGISDKDRLGIPDLLSAEGQEERMRISKLFARYFNANRGELRATPLADIKATVYAIAAKTGAVNEIIGDRVSQLLSLEEAKKRKMKRDRALDRERRAKRIKAPPKAEVPALPAPAPTVIDNNNIVVNLGADAVTEKLSQLTMDKFFSKLKSSEI
jgi:hypothetical protein